MSRTAWTPLVLMIAIGTATMLDPLQAWSAESDDVQAFGESASDLLNSPLTASAGTFLLSTSTKIKIVGNAGATDTEIDTKKDLGMKDKDRLRLDVDWHFAEHHKLRAMYFDISQSATRTLTRDITVGDTTYATSATVNSNQSIKVYELAYEYIFLKRPNYDLAGSFGIHAIKFGFDLTGTGTVNGISGQFRTESAAVTAPLPVFGLRWMWEFSPQWYANAQGQVFKVTYGDYKGTVTDALASVTRMFGKHFGVGLGYNTFSVRVDVNKNSFDGSLKWRYSGAQVYVTGAF